MRGVESLVIFPLSSHALSYYKWSPWTVHGRIIGLSTSVVGIPAKFWLMQVARNRQTLFSFLGHAKRSTENGCLHHDKCRTPIGNAYLYVGQHLSN